MDSNEIKLGGFCSASLEFHLVITKLILTKSNGVLSSSARSVHLRPEFKFDKCGSETMMASVRHVLAGRKPLSRMLSPKLYRFSSFIIFQSSIFSYAIEFNLD